MIYELSREIDAHLRAKKFPFPTVYAGRLDEVRPQTSVTRGCIVIGRDPEASESFALPRSQVSQLVNGTKARVDQNRTLTCRATVFAQATFSGSRLNEHERLCDQMVDMLVVALRHVIAPRQHVYTPPLGGRYLRPEELGADELKGFEQWSGVAYRLFFSVERGILNAAFDGSGLELGSIDAISNRTTVPGALNDTACGA